MGDFVPKFEREMELRSGSSALMLPTAGAIPVRNEKGQITMQKVKVTRYVAGRAPDFPQQEERDAEGEESEGDDESRQIGVRREGYKKADRARDRGRNRDVVSSRALANDRRFRRIEKVKSEIENEHDDRRNRHNEQRRRRAVPEPEIIARNTVSARKPTQEYTGGNFQEEEEDNDNFEEGSASSGYSDSGGLDRGDKRSEARRRARHRRGRERADTDEEEREEDSDLEEFERRRELLRQKTRERRDEEELLAKQQEEDEFRDEDENEDEFEDSDADEDSDSESDTAAPRLKPVFVRKRDRVTLQDTEKEEQRLKQLHLEQQKLADERKRQSIKIAEDCVKRELEMEKQKKEENLDLAAVPTDDENEEISYETWKVREMKRIKRDRDEREALAKEKAEIENVHNMTEDERRAYLRANPRVITNKQEKGKYKFLQKYYHRGVFFLNEDEDVYQRNFAEATLEDRFDKSVLPKVMQVKDFGKAGRTKWTHLTNEDTTDHQGPWVSETQLNTKFFVKHAGGIKDVFDRPAAKRRKI